MKFKIGIDETRSFKHILTVEAENIEKLESLLIDVEENEIIIDLEDYETALKERGCKILVSSVDQDGDIGKIECTDIEEVQENEEEQC